jgi:hypothetical protein
MARGVVQLIINSGLARWSLVMIRKLWWLGEGSFNSCHKILSINPLLGAQGDSRELLRAKTDMK